MWASVTVCREEVIQNSKFRHRPGLLPGKGRVGGGLEGGEKSFQPTQRSPAYLGFPWSLFNWIVSQAVILKCDVHRRPPWNWAAQEACVCFKCARRRNDRLLGKMRPWTTSAAPAALTWGTGALVKRHTIPRKEGLLLGLSMKTRRKRVWSRGGEKKRRQHCLMASRNLWKLEKLYQLLHWANSPSSPSHSSVFTSKLLLILIIVYKKAADQYCTRVISAQWLNISVWIYLT